LIKNKILVAGGTGFIGYHLCKFFTKKKWIVHSISKKNTSVSRRVKNVKYFKCDITKKKNFKKLDQFYDYIINLSGYVDHRNIKFVTKMHYNGTKNLVLNFLDRKPKKFIHIGTSIENGKKVSPQKESVKIRSLDTKSFYGNAKLKTTIFLLSLYRKFRFPVCIIRFYLVYGPTQDNNRLIPFVINNSIKSKEFNCSPGNQYRDFMYIDDGVNAIYKALISNKSAGQIFNIGSGKPIKIKDLIKKIVKKIGKGTPKFSKNKLRVDEPNRLYPNILKAKNFLSWTPKVSLENGLYKTILYFKKNIKKG